MMANFATVEKTLKTRRAELAERVSSIDTSLKAPLSADFEDRRVILKVSIRLKELRLRL